MTIALEQQLTALYNYRILVAQNVLVDYCIRYAVQESDGEGQDKPSLDSVRILDYPQSLVTKDPLLHYTGPLFDKTSMTTMISRQQDTAIESEDQERIQATTWNDTNEVAIPYDYAPTKGMADTQVQHSPPLKAVYVLRCLASKPTFSPSAKQVENFVLDDKSSKVARRPPCASIYLSPRDYEILNLSSVSFFCT